MRFYCFGDGVVEINLHKTQELLRGFNEIIHKIVDYVR
jgi:hypothetical protein